MTDKYLEDNSKEIFDNLRETAIKVVKLETLVDKDGKFLTEIYDAGMKFCDSYFASTETGRANIETFRREIAQLMIETKYFNMCCHIVTFTYHSGFHLEEEENVYMNLLLIYLLVLQNFSDASDDLATALANELEFVQIIKRMIEEFLAKYSTMREIVKLEDTEEKTIDAALGLALNMSLRESNALKLRDFGIIECLKPYLKLPNKKHGLMALASLAGIINESECGIISSNIQTVEYLLNCMSEGLKDTERSCKDGWSCKECCVIIKQLARNDANISLLVDIGALELLVELGRTGDEDEQYETVSALWALCFDKEMQTLITGKPELGVVDLLVDLKSSENKNINKGCNGALWTLRDSLKKSNVKKYNKIAEHIATDREKNQSPIGKKKQATSEVEALSKGHVMISYQWADQQVLTKVRDNLQAKGYKVWMDIDQMTGSTLHSMADAVEGADVFLMCMSEKYKHSKNCRAEAEYAYQQQKRVIPLKMERGYTPDGWLGIMAGSKLFFEFSPKYPFVDKMIALLKEIESDGNV